MIRTLSSLVTLIAGVVALGCSEGPAPGDGTVPASGTGQPTDGQAVGGSAAGGVMDSGAGTTSTSGAAEGGASSVAGASGASATQDGTPALGGTGSDAAGMSAGGTMPGGANAGESSSAGGVEAAAGADAGAGVGGTGAGGAAGNAGGSPDAGTGGDSSTIMSPFGDVLMQGAGVSDMQYETALVSRNEVPYVLITNGWGPGFQDHTVSWLGTSFVVESMNGTRGSMGEPASYPTVFCGRYSVRQVPECGLPAPIAETTSIRTGWAWKANDNAGEYNAAYDIWVGDGTRLQGYLMVWLRDPPMNQPAGSPNMAHQGVTVANVPGTWNIWDGTVNGLPIINWVRAEGEDTDEIEFDVMDFLRDADMRGLSYPGTHVNVVAVGFEIWEGPIANLETVDFYVDVQ